MSEKTPSIILSQAFRLFFLASALWAIIAIILWVFATKGNGFLQISPYFFATDWHVHELIYGFGVAVLTAIMTMQIPNWNGSVAIKGASIFWLFILWLMGRIVLLSDINIIGIAVIENAYLALLFLIILISTLKNFTNRNQKKLLLVGLFLAGNLFFHWEVYHEGYAEYAIRFSLVIMLYMMMLILGRVIIGISKELSVKENIELPVMESNWFDGFVIFITWLGLLVWVYNPLMAMLHYALFAMAFLHLLRLWRWGGHFKKVLCHGVLCALHLSYYGIVIGFIVLGFSNMTLDLLLSVAGIHIWALAFGLFAVAMMIRAGLNVVQSDFFLPISFKIVYGLMIVSALSQLCYGLLNGATLAFYMSAGGWMLSFAVFLIIFTPAFFNKN